MSEKQLICNSKVSIKYFSIESICSGAYIKNKLDILIKDNPESKLYVGVTHHPCGRFTGDYYANSLPSSLKNISYSYKSENDELISERAHHNEFELMYLVCYCNSKELVLEFEEIAINYLKSNELVTVLNTTKGKNGNLIESEFYFLYVCKSKIS